MSVGKFLARRLSNWSSTILKNQKAKVYGMNSDFNLPPEQRGVQRLVNQFNADEDLWHKLRVERCLRRLSHRKLSAKRHELLDLIDLLGARPLQDLIGFFRK
jgi:hypothetical protein